MHGSGSLGMFEQPDKLICVGNRNYLLEAEFTDGRLRGLVINNKENSLSMIQVLIMETKICLRAIFNRTGLSSLRQTELYKYYCLI